MDKLKKQPYEQFTVAVDFSAVLVDGESIVGQTVVIESSAGADKTSEMIVPGSPGNDGSVSVVATIKAGDPGDSPHKLTFRCETSIGHKWEHDIQLTVVEI